MDRIRFKDLSFPLKISIAAGWFAALIWFTALVIMIGAFLTGLFIGLTS